MFSIQFFNRSARAAWLASTLKNRWPSSRLLSISTVPPGILHHTPLVVQAVLLDCPILSK